MYTEEDINNLAEFMYLAHRQVYWEIQSNLLEWEFLNDNNKEAWKASAKVALDFIKPKLMIDYATPEGKELVREMFDNLHK